MNDKYTCTLSIPEMDRGAIIFLGAQREKLLNKIPWSKCTNHDQTFLALLVVISVFP